MKDIQIEHMQFISKIYQDPYCVCDMYEDQGELYRIFRIQDENIQKEIYAVLLENEIKYGFYGQQLCICVPYYKGVNLLLWKQQKHSILERIHICREILFKLISAPYTEILMDLCLDANNITIMNDQVAYFDHPNFSIFLRPSKSTNMPQRAATMFLEILEEDLSIHKQNYLKNPNEYQLFAHRVMWKRYRSYDALMKDLSILQHTIEHRQLTKVDWTKRIILLSISVLCILFMIFVFLEWKQLETITYDGIPNIGTERLSP